MPQTHRLAGSRAVAHVTSRDTPRPPLFRDDDGWPCLRAIPGPVVGHEEVGVAGAKMGCRIARSDPKISSTKISLTLRSTTSVPERKNARPPNKAVKGWYTVRPTYLTLFSSLYPQRFRWPWLLISFAR